MRKDMGVTCLKFSAELNGQSREEEHLPPFAAEINFVVCCLIWHRYNLLFTSSLPTVYRRAEGNHDQSGQTPSGMVMAPVV
jgi:hypothetical protein